MAIDILISIIFNTLNTVKRLSSQNDYDHGMWALKSANFVLRAAGGAVKQQFSGEGKGVLMLKSLEDVNAPKFLTQGVPIMQGHIAQFGSSVVLAEAWLHWHDHRHLEQLLNQKDPAHCNLPQEY